MTQYVVIALALSLAGNVFLWKSRDSILEEKGRIELAAKTCSDGVAKLESDAKDNEKRVSEALQKAAVAESGKRSAAQSTMLLQPTAPKDSCASSASLAVKKISERKAK